MVVDSWHGDAFLLKQAKAMLQGHHFPDIAVNAAHTWLRGENCLLIGVSFVLLACRSIDQLNRERKLQQQAAGAELRVLEDQYYSALRKNLEISAACQSIEEEMELLQTKIGRIEKQQQQPGEQKAGEQREAEQQQQQQQEEGGGGEAAAADGPVANGVGDEGQQSAEQQGGEQQGQQPEAGEGPADMEQ
jgi:hypothetical protein